MSESVTVSDLYRRILEIRNASPNMGYAELESALAAEYKGKPFPLRAFVTIPEMDEIAPEEDWTSGLPLVLRGIQNESWKEIAHGIVMSLEQVENYPKESGREDAPEKEWHNRETRIKEFASQSVGKWMPEDLMNLAKNSANK
ncbi:MAG: hypothetical protein ACK5NT_08255 [Pyrinomonadaceae bacterium]